MKIRYLAAVFAAAFAVSGTAALADTYTAAEADGTSVRIHVTSDAGNARYTVYLLKPGKTLPEDSSGETDVFERIESVDASNDEAGVFASHELAFELSENAQTGVYTVIMGGGELSGRELNITYAANDVLNGALAAVNGASASEAADAAVNYNGTAWSVDTDNEAYKHHKNEVSESIYEIINGKAANAADVTRAFEQACALSELKHCGEEEICDKLFLYESYLGTEYSDEVKNKNEDLISVFAELRTAESMKTPQELASVLRASEGIMKLNKSDRDGAVGIIKEYNDVFNIDLASTIDKVDEYQLAKGIIAARPYSTPAEIKETVTELCDELSKPKEENTTTGSGVSGGGSLHGGGSMGGGTTGGGTSTPSVSVRPDGTVIESTTDGVDSALLKNGTIIEFTDYLDEGYRLYDAEGNVAEPSVLARSQVLSILESKDGNYTNMVFASHQENGTIEEMRDGRKYITVNGTEYECTEQFINNENGNIDINVGDYVTLSFDFLGRVVYVTVGTTGSGVAYLLNAYTDEGGECGIKVLDEDGTTRHLKLKPKMSFNGGSGSAEYVVSELKSGAETDGSISTNEWNILSEDKRAANVPLTDLPRGSVLMISSDFRGLKGIAVQFMPQADGSDIYFEAKTDTAGNEYGITPTMFNGEYIESYGVVTAKTRNGLIINSHTPTADETGTFPMEEWNRTIPVNTTDTIVIYDSSCNAISVDTASSILPGDRIFMKRMGTTYNGIYIYR